MRIKSTLILAAISINLGACANMFVDNRSPEEIVAERSQERLDALMEKDMKGLATALKYTTPSFRQHTQLGEYNARVAGRGYWNEVKVNKVDCEENVCDVTVDMTYTLPQLGFPTTRPIDEKWIKIDGVWWIYHK